MWSRKRLGAIPAVVLIAVGAVVLWRCGQPRPGLPKAREHCGRDGVEPLGNTGFLISQNRPRGTGRPAECIYVSDEIFVEPRFFTDSANAAVAVRARVVVDAVRTGGDGEPVAFAGTDGYPSLGLFKLRDGSNPFDLASRIVAAGYFAAPNYAMIAQQVFRFGPYDNPVAVATGSGLGATKLKTSNDPLGSPSQSPLSVDVIDTGFDLASWPKSAATTPTADWATPTGETTDLTTGRAAGHGTFVTSIIARYAPQAKIRVIALPSVEAVIRNNEVARLAKESDIATLITTATAEVLNLSFSSYGCAAQVDGTASVPTANPCPPNALRLALLARHSGASHPLKYVTVAAGNDHVDTATYPAAFALDTCFGAAKSPCKQVQDAAARNDLWLFGVGTNDKADDGKQFSNHGKWVAVLADGGHVYGWLPARGGIQGSQGVYTWSGTSFAAPCVAALLATGQESKVADAVANKATTQLSCASKTDPTK